MKFLIISQHAGSNVHGMVIRNYSLARELVKRGHDVSIVTSAFAHTRSVQPGESRFRSPERVDGIDYYWLPAVKYSQSRLFGRAVSMLAFLFVSLIWALTVGRRNQFDFVISSSPVPLSIYPGYAVAKTNRARLIFEVRDLWPLTLKMLGGYSVLNPFVMLMQHAEVFACRNSDLITSVLRNAENYLQSKGLPPNRFIYLPNGMIEAVEESPLPEVIQCRLDNLKQTGMFIIGYAGAIGLANSIDCLIQSLTNVNSNIVVVLAGDGEHVTRLKQLAAEFGVADRVIFIGRINPSQVKAFLNMVDVGFIAAKRSPIYRFGASPTKMNDYLAAGLPILYGVNDPGNAVEASGCGVQFLSEDADSCATAVADLHALAQNERDAMGRKGKEWGRVNQDWSIIAERFLERLAKLERLVSED